MFDIIHSHILMAVCQKRSISYGIINFALGLLNQNHFCIFFFFFIFIFLQYWKKKRFYHKTDFWRNSFIEQLFKNENYTSDKHSETLLVLVLHLLTLSTMKFSLFFWKMPKTVLGALLRSFLPLYGTIFKCREYVLNEFPYIIFSGRKI